MAYCKTCHTNYMAGGWCKCPFPKSGDEYSGAAEKAVRDWRKTKESP